MGLYKIILCYNLLLIKLAVVERLLVGSRGDVQGTSNVRRQVLFVTCLQ